MGKFEKLKIVLGTFVSVLFIFEFIKVAELKRKNEELAVRIEYLESKVQNDSLSISNQINNIQQELTNKINEATSILANVSTKAIYENQKMYIDIYIEPKEVLEGEQVFVKGETSSGIEKVEASILETGKYYARLETKLNNEARITVLLETETSIRQQSLEPININDMFAFGIESHWGADKDWMDAEENEMTITVTPQNDISKNFNINSDKVELVVFDWNGKEVGRELMKKVNIDTYGWIYRSKLANYFGKEGGYNTVFEMTTEEGIKYSSRVGGFDIYENGDVEYRTASDVIYPVW